MEVLGAIASAVTLAQVSSKGLSVLLEVRDVRRHFAELREEIDFIDETVQSVRQRHQFESRDGEKVPSPAAQPILSRVRVGLESIASELRSIKETCQKDKLDEKSDAKKWKWIRKSGKITDLLKQAQTAKCNLVVALLLESLDFSSEMLSTQKGNSLTIAQRLTAVEQKVAVAPELLERVIGLERLLADVPEVMGFLVSFESQTQVNKPIEDTSRIQEVDHDAETTSSAVVQSPGPSTGEIGSDVVVQAQAQLTTYAAFRGAANTDACDCSCHTQSRRYLGNPTWTRWLFGKLEFSYRQLYTEECHHCYTKDRVLINWKPPDIPWARFWRSGPYYSLRFALRQTRVQPSNSFYWSCLKSTLLFRDEVNKGLVFFPDDCDEVGMTVVEYLIYMEHFDVLEMLFREWASILPAKGLPRSDGQQARYRMWGMRGKGVDGRDGRLLREVEELVDDLEPPLTDTSVHEAAASGSGVQEALKNLDDKTARTVMNEFDYSGLAPLHHAAWGGHFDAVDALVSAGADVNIKNFEGWTPLMFSARFGHTDCMARLLLAKARLNDADSEGSTAVHYAARFGHVDALLMLLKAGASPSSRNAFGEPPLHKAAEANRKEGTESHGQCAQLLLDHGASIQQKTHSGQTAVHLAVVHNNLPVLKCLVHARASLSSTTNSGRNILHLAATHANHRTLQFLLGQIVPSHIHIDTQLKDQYEDSAWDLFIYCVYEDPWKLYFFRQPDDETQAAFVELYKRVRENNLRHDITLLQQITQALARHEPLIACTHLAEMVDFKSRCHNHECASFYRGIAGRIRCGQVQTSLSTIEDALSDLQQSLDSDPWDQVSNCDYLKPNEDSGSEASWVTTAASSEAYDSDQGSTEGEDGE